MWPVFLMDLKQKNAGGFILSYGCMTETFQSKMMNFSSFDPCFLSYSLKFMLRIVPAPLLPVFFSGTQAVCPVGLGDWVVVGSRMSCSQ